MHHQPKSRQSLRTTSRYQQDVNPGLQVTERRDFCPYLFIPLLTLLTAGESLSGRFPHYQTLTLCSREFKTLIVNGRALSNTIQMRGAVGSQTTCGSCWVVLKPWWASVPLHLPIAGS